MYKQEDLLEQYPNLKNGDTIIVRCTMVSEESTVLKSDNLEVGKEYEVPWIMGGLNIAFNLQRSKLINFATYMYVDGGDCPPLGFASFEFVRVK